MAARRIAGGCQCGAVRFAATAETLHATVCHCRMCQRATGNFFAPLVEVPNEAVVWERGQPAVFASSSIAERGFCAACGTPLFLRDFDGAVTELMIGALDDPESIAPVYNYGVESKIAWVDGLSALPGYRTGHGPNEGPVAADAIVSRQAPPITEEPTG